LRNAVVTDDGPGAISAEGKALVRGAASRTTLHSFCHSLASIPEEAVLGPVRTVRFAGPEEYRVKMLVEGLLG